MKIIQALKLIKIEYKHFFIEPFEGFLIAMQGKIQAISPRTILVRLIIVVFSF